MKKHIVAFVVPVIAALLVATFAVAQPGIGITKTAPLTGTGSSGSPLRIAPCLNGSAYVSNGTTWSCAAVASGDITGVTAGSGLTGGSASGEATLNVGAGSGISVSADAVTLNMTAENCSAGSFLDNVSAVGVFGCVAEVGDIESVSGTSPISASCTSGACTVTTTTSTNTIMGRVSGGTGVIEPLTGGQATSLLTLFSTSSTTQGVVPGSNSCGATCFLRADQTWAVPAGAGDITDVTAGAGLTGGASSGNATIDVGCGTGLTCNANDVTLNMTAQSCSAGSYITGATATGVFTCTADSSAVYTAGDGLTLTASDFDLTYTSDFTITADQLDLSTAVTAPGTLNVASGITGGTVLSNAWIQSTTGIYAGTSSVVGILNNGTIYGGYATMGHFNLMINPVGYLESTTQPRSVTVYDGTGTAAGDTIAFFDGTDRNVDFSANVSVGVDLNVARSATLGDDNTDVHNVFGRAYYLGTAPTLSSCTSPCSIASYSTDARGRITCTDNSAATCTVTFSVAYQTNAPACSVQLEEADGTLQSPVVTAISTSAFSFVQSAGTVDDHAYTYRCDGML